MDENKEEEKERKPKGYWTREKVFDESKKYATRKSFEQGNGSAYTTARKNKWLDQMPWLPIPTSKPHGYWTKDRVFEESKKYTSKSEFQKGNNRAYTIAWKNNWLDEMGWLELKQKPNGYWTKERVFEISKSYTSRSKFSKENSHAYNIARVNKWLEEMTWFKNYTLDSPDQVDCIYIYKFEEQHAIYVGRTIDRKGRDIDHHTIKSDTVYKFFTENNLSCPPMEVIEDNLTIREGQEQEGFWKDSYESEGWIILNKAKTGGVGGIGAGKWHYETCKAEASKYKTRSEFNDGNGRAYKVSLKKGWLDEFFPNPLMDPTPKSVDQLDLEGNYIQTFTSISEASRELNIDRSCIGNCCKGKRETAGGFKWRYHKEEESEGDKGEN